jgi:hypothetical protein
MIVSELMLLSLVSYGATLVPATRAWVAIPFASPPIPSAVPGRVTADL